MKTKTMQEVLKENKQKVLEQRIARNKKEEKKEIMLGYFVLVAIVVMCCSLIYLINNDNKQCTEKYGETYCSTNV